MLASANDHKTFVFYLVPEFTLLAFSSAIEVLRLANQVVGHQRYRWRLVSAEGHPVTASNGVCLSVDRSLAEERARQHDRPSMALVCSGRRVEDRTDRSLEAWLRDCHRQRISLGALCTGAYILAKSGLLENRRCAIHWENSPAFAEQFDRSVLTCGIFEVDDGIHTCAGGAASFDMMVHLVGRELGPRVAAEICNQALVSRLRDSTERQRLPFAFPQGVNNPIIKAAVNLMADNLSEPITLAELGLRLRLSRRQIERVFQNELHCSPARYYLKLRLERAKLLLTQTSMAVVDVAVACGFVSASHFSRCYRVLEGRTPQAERKSWMPRSAHWGDGGSIVATKAIPGQSAAGSLIESCRAGRDASASAGGICLSRRRHSPPCRWQTRRANRS